MVQWWSLRAMLAPAAEPALLPAPGLRRLTHHRQERADGGVVVLRRLNVDVVTRGWDQDQPRAGDRRVQRLRDPPRRAYVLGAIDQQCRDSDRRQYRAKVGVGESGHH